MAPRIAAGQKDALTEQRREQIVSAAMRRWLMDGFDVTTVASIAREASLAKGTVYLYFKTKQEILDEAIRRHSLLPDIREHLEALASLDIPSEDLIPTLIRGIWERAKERASVIQFFIREVSVRPEHARRFVEQVVIPVNELTAEFFRPRIEAGLLRDVDMFIASRALLGMVVAFIFTQEVFGGKRLHPLDDERITGTISDVFLYGIMPRTGVG